jgi:excisionase family DNA binding protein
MLRLNRFMSAEQVRELYGVPPGIWEKLHPLLPVKCVDDSGVPYYLESEVDGFLAAWLRQARKPKEPAQEPEWLSVQQAAAVTGLSEATIRRAITTGELRPANNGGTKRPLWRIKRQDLLAWMEAKKGPGGAAVPPKSELRGLVDRYFG